MDVSSCKENKDEEVERLSYKDGELLSEDERPVRMWRKRVFPQIVLENQDTCYTYTPEYQCFSTHGNV